MIVIASSSFYAEDVDEVQISSAPAYNATTDVTTITLSQPLVYTHLGEIVSVAGETKVLDMRAEVTVLTRNVLVTVSCWWPTLHAAVRAPELELCGLA